MIYVYLISSVSGMHYVGITSKTVESRWATHCKDSAAGSKLALHNAIRKHGPESFKIETIETVETWEEACQRERFWIAWIGTRPPFGYNLTDGGDGAKGLRWSEERRVKQSLNRKGAKHTTETRMKISCTLKGSSHTKESRDKMSSSHKGVKKSAETRERMSAAARLRPRVGGRFT